MSSADPKKRLKTSHHDSDRAPATAAATTTTTTTYAALQRGSGSAVLPTVSLVTGMYGSRGERIRHVATVGALQLPTEALTMLLAGLPGDRPVPALPALDSVPRPTVAEAELVLTHVAAAYVPSTEIPGESIKRVVARNMRVVKAPAATKEPARIRGGGDEEAGAAEPGATASPPEPPAPPEVASSQVPVPVVPPVPLPVMAPPVAAAMAPPTVAVPLATPTRTVPHGAPPPFSASVAAPPVVPAPTIPIVTSAAPVPVVATAPATTTPLPPPVAHAPAPAVGAPPSVPVVAWPTALPRTTTPTRTTTVPVLPSPTPVSTLPVPLAPLPTVAAPAVWLPTTTTEQPAAAETTPAAAPSSAATVSAPSATATATPPTPVPPTLADKGPVVIQGLAQRPTPQWEQHKPGTADEMTVDATSKSKAPDWYLPDAAVDYERACLPEWFDGSAPHRTVASYLLARTQMIKMADDLGTKYVTATLVRRSIPGDAGSLLRLHEFLTAHSLMNEEATNDSAPTATALLGTDMRPLSWTARQDERLVQVLVQASKERTAPGQSIDWEAMAEQVGSGKTAAACEQRFLALPLETALSPPAGSITPDTTMSEGEPSTTASSTLTAVQDLVADCLPAVRHKIVETALEETSSLSQAQKAALAGLAVHEAAQQARSASDALAQMASHVVDVRLQKLEHRLALMDDVEALLEAERVALELERRDLYTARCRHWFGGV